MSIESRPLCEAYNARGLRCGTYACDGSKFCRRHTKTMEARAPDDVMIAQPKKSRAISVDGEAASLFDGLDLAQHTGRQEAEIRIARALENAEIDPVVATVLLRITYQRAKDKGNAATATRPRVTWKVVTSKADADAHIAEREELEAMQ